MWRAVTEKLCLLQGMEGKVSGGAATHQEGEGHALLLSLRQPWFQVPLLYVGILPNHTCAGKQGWTPWEDSGRHPEKLLRGWLSIASTIWKIVDYSDLLFRALRPALGLKHANTVKFMVGKVNLAAFLSELFVTWCELLLSRAFGQLVQSGLSPIMPTTTLATGTVHQTHIGLELGVHWYSKEKKHSSIYNTELKWNQLFKVVIASF